MTDERTRTFRLGFVSGLFFFVSVISTVAYIASVWVSFRMAELEPPRAIEAPLRTAAGVFMMTTQYETRVTGGGSRWRTLGGFEKVMHVDLWRLDAASAQPAWRKRLLTEREGNSLGLRLLGADGDRLWLFLREPLVVSPTNGDVLADAKAIEERNPPLRGVLPKQMGHYRFFDGHGLVFTAADARAWLLDAQTLAATAWQPNSAKPRASAIAPAYFSPTTLTSFQKRGLLLASRWLGVLTDDEAAAVQPKPLGERPGAMEQMRESMRAPPDLSHSGPKRYRLWHAKVQQVSAAPPGWSKDLPDNWGKRPLYTNFAVFEKSPEFLQAGLLSDGRSNLPLLPKEPDSVLVLHRDRIDEDGRLQVTRFAGPDGRVLWATALPLSLLHSVMPGKESLVLFGRAYIPDRPRPGDPYHSAHEWVIALDLKDGAIRTFNVSAADAEK